MQFRNLGSSGLKVSTIGLGTNQFGGKVDLETTKNIIAAALEAGVNFIDTAGHSPHRCGTRPPVANATPADGRFRFTSGHRIRF